MCVRAGPRPRLSALRPAGPDPSRAAVDLSPRVGIAVGFLLGSYFFLELVPDGRAHRRPGVLAGQPGGHRVDHRRPGGLRDQPSRRLRQPAGDLRRLEGRDLPPRRDRRRASWPASPRCGPRVCRSGRSWTWPCPAWRWASSSGAIGDLVIADHLGKPTDFFLGYVCPERGDRVPCLAPHRAGRPPAGPLRPLLGHPAAGRPAAAAATRPATTGSSTLVFGAWYGRAASSRTSSGSTRPTAPA